MRKRHTPEQIVRKLREAEAQIAAGAPIPEVARKLGVSEATLHRWRNQYGGMKAHAIKHLKELEKENARLKKIVADQAVDISILKEVSRGNFSRARSGGRPPSSTFVGGWGSLSVGYAGWRSVSPGPLIATWVVRPSRTSGWSSE
jgi:putative transposase